VTTETDGWALTTGLAATLAAGLTTVVGESVTPTADGDGAPVLDVPAGAWVKAAQHLRDAAGLDFFEWLSAVDCTDKEPPGVEIVLHVVDSASGGGPRMRRALLRTWVPDPDPHLASLTGVYPGAAFHERETFEMFGVVFDGFEDGQGPLRPLLLPDGFEGTPLRKSFMLAARAVKDWPGAKEPGDSGTGATRKKMQPPGVPDAATWGPKPLPGAAAPDAAAESGDADG